MGYTGLGLEVDLGQKDFSEFYIKDREYEESAGTAAIAYKIAKKLYRKKFDPLSEKNFIIFAAGLLTATGLPGATKTICITKNPLNRTFGAGVVGGKLAFDMKRAGYDIIVIKGVSDEAVTIKVESGKVSFENAEKLWGKDIVKTTNLIKSQSKGSVIAIGPAGENLVPISLVLVDAIHHLGKGGLGAVLGSKKIKAIVISADGGKKPTIFDEKRFEAHAEELRKRLKADELVRIYSKAGIMYAWQRWGEAGYLTNRMRSKRVGSGLITEFGLEKYLQRIKKSGAGCYGCPSPCKARLKLGNRTVNASLYLGVALMGIRCGLQTAEEAVECHDAANRLGIDELTFSELFDVLMTFKEEAKVFEDEIGFEIRRDSASVMRLLTLTAYRIGIGEYVGRGMEGLAEKFGEWVKKERYFIRNMEWIFDPRVSFGSEAFGQLTNLRGGHEGPVTITALPGKSEESLKRYLNKIGGTEKVFENGFRMELYTIAAENWLWVLNGMGFCRRESIARNLDLDLVRDLFNSSTGFEIDSEGILKGAEKAISIARELNCREGYDSEDDLPPQKFFEPLRMKNRELVIRDYLTGEPIGRDEVIEMLRRYYNARGWKKNGCP